LELGWAWTWIAQATKNVSVTGLSDATVYGLSSGNSLCRGLHCRDIGMYIPEEGLGEELLKQNILLPPHTIRQHFHFCQVLEAEGKKEVKK
jgi:hypothetical protein